MNKKYLDIGCDIGVTHQIVYGKWKLVILGALQGKVLRFGELHRELPVDVSQGYVTQQLKELVRDGLVHREVFKEIPPKVEYSLTDIGNEFIVVLDSMKQWGAKYLERLKEVSDVD